MESPLPNNDNLNSDEKEKGDGDEGNLLDDTVIKVSPSDIEMNSSDNEDENVHDDLLDPTMKFKESDKSDNGESESEFNEDAYRSPSPVEGTKKVLPDSVLDSDDLDDEDYFGERPVSVKRRKTRIRKKKVIYEDCTVTRKKKSETPQPRQRKVKSMVGKPKKKRGRPKQPRRLDGSNAKTSSEESDAGDANEKEKEKEASFRLGCGYNVEFKMKVLNYAETHSTSATAEKFGLNAKRVREWKGLKERIVAESRGILKRRPRTDCYTLDEKLQAVRFAEERSVDEARLLYNVDRRTLGKWKAKKAYLEAGVKTGHGDSLRSTGCGRKPQYTHIEGELRDWIVALRLKGVTVNHRMILTKAKKLILESDFNGKQLEKPRPPSTGTWVVGFLKRQGLEGLLGTTLGREDPRELLTIELKTSDGTIKTLTEQIEIPENPNKRLRRSISLQDKINIIRRIENGETQGTVAKALRIATSTVQTIWSCRNEILRKYLNPKAKPKTGSFLWRTYTVIGAALNDWYEESIKTNKQISANDLLDKAIQLSETYKLLEFKADAKEWLKIFCKKHKLEDKLPETNPIPNTKETVEANPNQNSQELPQQSSMSPCSTAPSPEPCDASNDDYNPDININELFIPCNVQNGHPQDNTENKIHPPVTFPTHSTTSFPPINSHYAHAQPAPQQHRNSTYAGVPNSNSFNNSGSGIAASNNTQSITPTSLITSLEALKNLKILRNWISANYSPNDGAFHYHLNEVENAILRKRAAELGASNFHC